MRIAGVDEAGRGPLAGPLVVAAVILDPARPIAGIDDSKVLSERRREALFEQIITQALCYSVVELGAAEIDRHNIFQSTLIGMRLAVERLAVAPDVALFDGKHAPKGLACSVRAIVDGDALEPSIGAASILAKVHRDRLLCALDARYPDYGFARHKGYPTPEHLAALDRLGPCPEHRRSFAPVRARMTPGLL
jgi:ribonuclease HII